MKNMILVSILIGLATSACVSMSYSSSNVNGYVTQQVCTNGECHSLYGHGTITFDKGNELVTIECEGKPAVVLKAKEVKSYDCYTGTAVEQ